MFRISIYFVAALVSFAPNVLHAQGTASTGSIAGSADPGAQIVLTADGGGVIGIMATCDGAYKAEQLKPGRYSIVEGGPHHAVRKVSVEAGAVSHVDLGAASAESARACKDKK
jgi:hypothetical protein